MWQIDCNHTATTEIYTLSLHDALPICFDAAGYPADVEPISALRTTGYMIDRKSTRLNSSHLGISYAVFCLKKHKITYLYQVVCIAFCPLVIFILRLTIA